MMIVKLFFVFLVEASVWNLQRCVQRDDDCGCVRARSGQRLHTRCGEQIRSKCEHGQEDASASASMHHTAASRSILST
jgi:hypothetical protein